MEPKRVYKDRRTTTMKNTTSKTIAKSIVAGVTCAAIVIDSFICQHFNVMPAYWITAIMLVLLGLTEMQVIDEED